MIIYVSKGDNRSYGFSPELWSGNVTMVEVPDNFVGGRSTYNPETDKWIDDVPYVRTHEHEVKDVEYKRDELIAEANQTMYGWSIDIQTGDITDEDLVKLKAWRQYVKKLNTLDLNLAPSIEWPAKPE